MSEPSQAAVTTLREYMECVEELMEARVPVWYRGCGLSTHPLVPSIYRHPTRTTPPELLELEGQILQRFRERSVPYLATPASMQTDWDMLFLMQHFGVPTRLLDWT